MTSRATLVLANHRPETIPAAQRLMVRHDAVILEEPPERQFLSMLNGQVPIDTYLENQDLEYKEEIIDADEPYPHTRDELEVGAMTARLTLTDCRRIYPPIRRTSTTKARDMVHHYLRQKPGPS